MRDVLTRAQKYIQIEDVTRAANNRYLKKGCESDGQKIQSSLPKKASNRAVGAVNKTTQNPIKHHRGEVNTTPFKIPMDQVYYAIKVEISSGTRPLPPNPKGPRAEEYYVFQDSMGQCTVD